MAKRITREQEVIQRARGKIEKRTGKTPEQLYAEREKRLWDAVQLKVPDMVPIHLGIHHYPLQYAGLPESAMFYDPAAYQEALIQILAELDIDSFGGNGHHTSGLAMDKLGQQQFAWPGGPLRPDQTDQFLDMEIMKADEYDLFITDPGDYILRYYLPRAFGALAPLAKLPPLQHLVRYSNLVHRAHLFSTDVIQAFETLHKIGEEQTKYEQMYNKFGDIHEALGMPSLIKHEVGFSFGGSVGIPPFDLFANHLRGMRGVMIDMFKRPEKLLTACERFLEWLLARGVPAPPNKKIRSLDSGNHFMSEEFLSRKQFETFVWPTWKKFLLATINAGYIPCILMEGKNDDRIDFFLELPKATALIGLEKIDIARAKTILGGHLCIYGGIPQSLLWGGSPQEVEEYTKNIIKVCGKNGGFILSTDTGLDNIKQANLKALVDTARKYGQY